MGDETNTGEVGDYNNGGKVGDETNTKDVGIDAVGDRSVVTAPDEAVVWKVKGTSAGAERSRSADVPIHQTKIPKWKVQRQETEICVAGS